MKWTAGTANTWTQPETGSWTGICIRVVDLGTQEKEFKGKTKHVRMCQIVWEIPDQLDSENKPLTISKSYTSSLAEKANLRKDLEGWRGRPFTQEELGGFEVSNIIGKPCLLNLVTVQGQKGERVVVAGISPLPKGMPAPPKTTYHSQFVYSLDEHNPEVWNQLSERMQDWINRSEERQFAPKATASTASAGNASTITDDEIPF